MMGPLTERASIRGKISHERRVSCPRSRVCCTTIIVTLTKKLRRKNSFFKIKATGPSVVYFVWKNVSCTYFLFNRALSSLRFWNSIIPFLTITFQKKSKALLVNFKKHLFLRTIIWYVFFKVKWNFNQTLQTAKIIFTIFIDFLCPFFKMQLLSVSRLLLPAGASLLNGIFFAPKFAVNYCQQHFR